MSTCWFCFNPLEGDHRTGEHVIPNAIGGRKEVFNFICRTCNGTRGEAWDAELAKQFLLFSSAAGVRRSRGGKHPDFRVQTVSGEKLKLRADSVLVPEWPDITTEECDDKIDVTIRANDSKTTKNLLKKAVRDYPEFDFESASIRSQGVDSYLDEPLLTDFRFGGPEGGKSMVKSSLALLSEVNDVDKSTCGRALTYLLDPNPEAPSPFGFFFDADLIVNRPKDHLFHCVSVIGQPRKGRILGYVELFNFARMLILISDEYCGKAFQETYAVDPVTGRALDLRIDFDLVRGRLEDLFKITREPPEMYLEALQHTGDLVLALNGNRVRAMAIEKARMDANCEQNKFRQD